jgi:hypothetical protein
MNLIILIVICLLACAFLLYVLLQWIRDTKRKPESSGDTSEPKQSPGGIGRK